MYNHTFRNWLLHEESDQWSISGYLTKMGHDPDRGQWAIDHLAKANILSVRDRTTGRRVGDVPLAGKSIEQIEKELSRFIPSSNTPAASAPTSAGAKAGGTLVTDPTGTKMGQLFADHINREIAGLAARGEPDPVSKFISKGGMAATIYDERIHKNDEAKAKVVFQKTTKALMARLKVTSVNDIDDALKEALRRETGRMGIVKWSQSMSQQQSNMMYWYRCTHTEDFKDVAGEQRVYIGMAAEYYPEGIKWLADQITDFMTKNPQIAPYVFVKFKVRTQYDNTDRGDTCIVYIKVAQEAASMSQQIIDLLMKKLGGGFPDQWLHGLQSPALTTIKGGVTTVIDNVQTEPKQSYTSQIGWSFSMALKPYWGKSIPQTDHKRILEEAIKAAVVDLKRRGYPI